MTAAWGVGASRGDGVSGNGYPKLAGEEDRELIQDTGNARGESVLNKVGVTFWFVINADERNGHVLSSCTGLEEPDDCADSTLTSESEASSPAPSVKAMSFCPTGFLPVPNCVNH